MENGIFIDLQNKINVGKKSQKRIATFLKNYQDDYRKLKVTEVAQGSLTSNSTVVRFAKELGFLGFPEMKIELENQSKIFNGDENNRTVDISNESNHFDLIVQSFNMTKDANSDYQISNFVNLLKKSKQIDIYALGETNIVAQDFLLKLVRIGFNATAYQDLHTQHFIATNSKTSTVAVGISYSATTQAVLNNLKEAKKYGAKTILICKTGVKKPDYVDFILNVSATESGARVFSTTSRFTILFLLDLVYHELILSNSDFFNKKLDETRIKRK